MGNLNELAEVYGVATDYWDQAGNHHDVPESTVRSVLTSLGAQVDDEASIDQSLENMSSRDWRRMMPPVFIHRQWAEGSIWVHVNDGDPVTLKLRFETGGQPMVLQQVDDWTPPQEVRRDDGSTSLIGQASFRIPSGLPFGWHNVVAESPTGTAECPLVVTPDRVSTPPTGWGTMAQLYSIRSKSSWGLGDINDLGAIVDQTATMGADFLLVNPLHAAEVEPPMTPSPYLPSTRRFFNPLYLCVTDIPEYNQMSTGDQRELLTLGAELTAANVTPDLLDRDASWAVKREALQKISKQTLSDSRQSQFDEYRAEQGIGLIDFATWCALCESYGNDWHRWPDELHDPRSAAVAAERERLGDRVLFYEWAQWQIDQQLQSVQRQALSSGMSIGVVHDLAVGVHLEGSDSWRLQDVLAPDVTVGAPPDMFNQQGQNWDQPPWRPIALADQAFIPYRDMLRTILRHAGGIRVDHVLGLFRQWWIPAGHGAADGTYVRMDQEALVGILALEAQRAGAVLIGEDLGTLEDWIQESLNARGIQGVGVLWFQSGPDGILRPENWRLGEMASVTVHDLPPTGSFLSGLHIRLRDELGLLARPVLEEYADHRQEVLAWLAVARDYQVLSEDDVSAFDTDLRDMASGVAVDWVEPTRRDRVQRTVVALYALLKSSPSNLKGVHIPDLTGDPRTQNQPGTDQEYPNWRIPLTDAEGNSVLLEDLFTGPLAGEILAEFRR
jgi:4-alpha-glucanotransferase